MADAVETTPSHSLGRRLASGAIGVLLGFSIGFLIWAFNVLANRDLDYLVTGLTLGGIGFFSTSSKNGWRDTFLYFLLLGFLDN